MVKVYRVDNFWYYDESISRYFQDDILYVDNINDADIIEFSNNIDGYHPEFNFTRFPKNKLYFFTNLRELYNHNNDYVLYHDYIIDKLIKHGISESKIFYFHTKSSSSTFLNINYIEVNHFEIDSYLREYVFKDYFYEDIDVNSILSMNGKYWKLNRIYILKYLIDNGFLNKTTINFLPSNINLSELKYGFINKELENELNNITKNLDDVEWENDHYIGYPYNKQLYTKSNISIISETLYDGDFFPTEKTFRPILNNHPFVILSTKNFLSNMNELGYKTFFDNYDYIDDHIERFSKSLDNLNNIQTIKCDDIYYNKNLLIERSLKSLNKLKKIIYDNI